jgi:hypothetical protein
LSRVDRNRNARLARLRELVPHGNAIVGIDLADDTQAVVVTDHDSRVIARRRVSVRAWPQTFLAGTAILLDPLGKLYTAIGAGNLRARADGEAVGRAAMSNLVAL